MPKHRNAQIAIVCPICGDPAREHTDGPGGNEWKEMSFHLLAHLNTTRPKKLFPNQFRFRNGKYHR